MKIFPVPGVQPFIFLKLYSWKIWQKLPPPASRWDCFWQSTQVGLSGEKEDDFIRSRPVCRKSIKLTRHWLVIGSHWLPIHQRTSLPKDHFFDVIDSSRTCCFRVIGIIAWKNSKLNPWAFSHWCLPTCLISVHTPAVTYTQGSLPIYV